MDLNYKTLFTATSDKDLEVKVLNLNDQRVMVKVYRMITGKDNERKPVTARRIEREDWLWFASLTDKITAALERGHKAVERVKAAKAKADAKAKAEAKAKKAKAKPKATKKTTGKKAPAKKVVVKTRKKTTRKPAMKKAA